MTLLVAPTSTLGVSVIDNAERVVRQVTQQAPAPAPRAPQAPAQVQAPAAAPTPAAPAPNVGSRQTPGDGGYTPPLHGANPHGQGTIATLDVQPSATRPLAGDPTGAGDPQGDQEEVIVGRTRGEQQQDGTYRGHVTVVALFGNEVIGVDTNEGESQTGPLEPLQQNVLDQLCSGSGDQICLTVLRADSTTTDTGSTNSFAVASAQVGGADGISTGVAESNGHISEAEAGCQNAHGDSTAARVSAGGNAVADVASASSDSRACRDGTQEQQNSGRVIGLGGQAVPLPAEGCGAGTPNTVTGIPTIAPIVCNATDSNGTQAPAPYGVREALTVFALEAGGTALLKSTVAAAESRAAAPAQAPPTTPPADDGDVSDGGPEAPLEEPGDGDGPDDGPTTTTTAGPGGPGGPGDGDGGPTARANLAQTGVDALLIALLGLVAVRLGVALHTLAGRERTRPAQ